MKPKFNFIVSSIMPYHMDRFYSLGETFICSAISKYEKEYLDIQKSHQNEYSKSNLSEIRVAHQGTFEDLNFFKKGFFLMKSILFVQSEHTFIGLGGNIKPYDPFLVISVLIKRILRKKVYIFFNTNFTDRQRSILKEGLKVLLLSMYSGAICSSESSASYLKFLGFKKRKVLSGGFNTISISRFKKNIQNQDRNQFLFIGRVTEKKNIKFLLDVYKSYKELNSEYLPLKIIGNLSDEFNYLDYSKSIGLSEDIFVGPLDDKKITEELFKSSALLVPSKYEEWGNVVNESIATNTPVLVSETVMARNTLVKQFVNGLILEPDNKEGWISALNLLTNNKDLVIKLSQGADEFKKYADSDWFRESVIKLVGSYSMSLEKRK